MDSPSFQFIPSGGCVLGLFCSGNFATFHEQNDLQEYGPGHHTDSMTRVQAQHRPDGKEMSGAKLFSEGVVSAGT